MVLGNALRDYRENLKLSIVFGVLLVFVFFFLFFENMFVGSGTIFIEYNLLNLNPLSLILEWAILLIFLAFYSIFVSFIVFNVRNKLAKVKLEYYLSEKIHRFSFSLFKFFAFYVILLFLLSFFLLLIGVNILIINVLLLVVSLLLLFVPQSIVIDEEPIHYCILNNLEFLYKNPKPVIITLIVSIILLALLPLIELLFDVFYLMGKFVSLIILLVFIVPFIEIIKTRYYMQKFTLVKHLA